MRGESVCLSLQGLTVVELIVKVYFASPSFNVAVVAPLMDGLYTVFQLEGVYSVSSFIASVCTDAEMGKLLAEE